MRTDEEPAAKEATGLGCLEPGRAEFLHHLTA
jgi:hypothetical protein